jgi:hypothetical protein
MTTLQLNKCDKLGCSHELHSRRMIISNKWHFCWFCDKVVHNDWIKRHEALCEIAIKSHQ